MIKNNAFLGPDSLKTFLDPSNHTPPLVELPAELNPFASKGVRICAKLMYFLPLGNVKSLPAHNMIAELAKTGGLIGKDTIVESSSGNTVASMAVIGTQFGLSNTKAIVSHKISRAKLQLMRLLGVEVIVTQDPFSGDLNHPDNGIALAQRLAQESPSWINPAQYHNPANPAAHEKLTGPQIWQQTGREVQIFCAGLGTTGTLIGVGQYLRTQNPAVKVIGVSRQPFNLVSGVRTTAMLGEVNLNWQAAVDELVEVSTHASYEHSLRLTRAGILGGPSSGFAYAGLLQYLASIDKAGKLDELKNNKGEITAVFVAPDWSLFYLNDYFENLDDSYFPPIQNAKLLRQTVQQSATEVDILVDQAITRLYQLSPDKLIDKGAKVKLAPNIRIIDVRSNKEFSHAHLPGSENVVLTTVLNNIDDVLGAMPHQIIVFVGDNSDGLTAAVASRKNGFIAYSLSGGLQAWSNRKLPLISSKLKMVYIII